MEKSSKKKLRYAVVGLGYIAQSAVLPAFEHAENSELAALVSGDPKKLRNLGKKYKIANLYSYENFDDCLTSGLIDAVYICLPNSLHHEYTIRAAKAGIHVLCEKPMAVTETECQDMINVCEENRVKLMVAYRLHFQEANLKAAEIARSGKLGDPRIFNSVFAMNVKDSKNIRLKGDLGGGTLYDIGIYCINAARSIFQSEPVEVVAFSANNGYRKFREVDEMSSCILRFSGDRLATFTASFNADNVNFYEVVGTKGSLCLDEAYQYHAPVEWELSLNGKLQKKTFRKEDQFAPELLYFSDCVLKNKNPEPSGVEGLADVQIIRALYYSAEIGLPVKLSEFRKKNYPNLDQEYHRPPVKEQPMIHAVPPSGTN